MQKQRGNFLLQALLAVTLSFVFMPFFASKLAVRDMNAKMHSVTKQVEYVYEATTNYLRENKNNLNYGETEYADKELVEVLRQYGLPLGFRNETIFGQNMALNIIKKDDYIGASIKIRGGELSDMQTAELIRRMDFYARDEGNGMISVFVPVDSSLTSYTDIVLKEEPEDGIFLSELKMDGHDIDGLGGLGSEFTMDGTNGAEGGIFELGDFRKITVVTSDAEKWKNEFKAFSYVGSTDVYGPLNINGTDLNVTNMTVNYISASKAEKEGEDHKVFMPSLNAGILNAKNFMMISDSANFTAPEKWKEIAHNIRAVDYTLRINPSDDTKEGMHVYSDIVVTPDNTPFDADKRNAGIETDELIAEHIVVGQSDIVQLKEGTQSNVILNISLAGQSEFQDLYVEDIDNDKLRIIKNPQGTSAEGQYCAELFPEKGGNAMKYDKRSLAQHIICQYLFWETLEHRIATIKNLWH